LQISSSLAPLIDKFRDKLKGFDILKIPRIMMFSKDSVVKKPYPNLDIIERDGRIWIVHNSSENLKQYQMERYIDDVIHMLGDKRNQL